MPKESAVRSGVTVRVKRINTVMQGCHKDDVMRPLPWNREGRNVKWLGIDLTIDRVGKNLAKAIHVHVGRSEDGFVGVLPGPRKIIVICQHIDLSHRGQQGTEREYCGDGDNSAKG